MAWRILRDGRLVKEVETEQQAWAWIHWHHCYSVHHATTYEGYEIKEVPDSRPEEVNATCE